MFINEGKNLCLFWDKSLWFQPFYVVWPYKTYMAGQAMSIEGKCNLELACDIWLVTDSCWHVTGQVMDDECWRDKEHH